MWSQPPAESIICRQTRRCAPLRQLRISREEQGRFEAQWAELRPPQLAAVCITSSNDYDGRWLKGHSCGTLLLAADLSLWLNRKPLLNWELALIVAQFVSLRCYLMQPAYEVLSSRSSKKSADLSLIEHRREFRDHTLSHLFLWWLGSDKQACWRAAEGKH